MVRIRPEIKIPPRRYCSLVARPMYTRSYLNGKFLDLPILFRDAGRSFWAPVKRKDIGFGNRCSRGNRTRKRCLIRKYISIPTRDRDNFFRPPPPSSEIRYKRRSSRAWQMYVYCVLYATFIIPDKIRISQLLFLIQWRGTQILYSRRKLIGFSQ